MKLNPKILEVDGKPAFVVLPYDQYQALQAALEDALDAAAIAESRAREPGQKRHSTEDVKAMFGLQSRTGA